MITLLSLTLVIIAGIGGVVWKYTAPKCETLFDLMGLM